MKSTEIKNEVYNFFRLNLDKFGDDTEVHRQVYILHFTFSLGFIFVLILGTVALLQGNYPLALADYSVSVCIFVILTLLHAKQATKAAVILGMLLTSSFFFWLLIYGGVHKTAFVWYYTFPLYAVFISGARLGAVVSFLMIVAAIIFFSVDSHFPHLAQYDLNFKIRFVPSYLVVVLFSYLADNFRYRTKLKLLAANATMEQKVEERTAELVAKNEELKKVSTTDALTGLKNRMKLDELISYEISVSGRYDRIFSIILIDIDYFKKVNDRFGHISGDKVLKQFAAMLKKNIRSSDTAGRWGGEEFLIICPEADAEDALTLAEKLRLITENEVYPDVGRITASFGIACYVDGDNINTIIRRADDALYMAKVQRNDCCVK